GRGQTIALPIELDFSTIRSPSSVPSDTKMRMENPRLELLLIERPFSAEARLGYDGLEHPFDIRALVLLLEQHVALLQLCFGDTRFPPANVAVKRVRNDERVQNHIRVVKVGVTFDGLDCLEKLDFRVVKSFEVANALRIYEGDVLFAIDQ